MRQWWYVLIMAVFLFAFSVYRLGAQESCAKVYALGYDGYKGVSIPLFVCSRPGHGYVFLSMDRPYGDAFQNAVMTAKSVFENRYGRQPLDYYIIFDASPTYFDGESVGLAVYAGMFASTFGVSLDGYAFTGALAPDGSVLPVSFVPEKAAAFDGTVVAPADNCFASLLCISNVSELEDALRSKRV